MSDLALTEEEMSKYRFGEVDTKVKHFVVLQDEKPVALELKEEEIDTLSKEVLLAITVLNEQVVLSTRLINPLTTLNNVKETGSLYGSFSNIKLKKGASV